MSYLVNQSIERLKYNNVRITPQRHAILEYLIDMDTHPTADDIYKALSSKFPSMSVATVYNNLKLFIQLGLVKEMKYGDASSRFDFASTEHYHAICTNCGKIEDVYYPGLDDAEEVTSNLTGFKVTSHRLEIYGLCPECQ
ncbi:peroxide-responsive transcriptional repressor PerR [Marinilactibacillus sp. GCM10026970]|uniref:peroxide-responsive transcriptional repressor PerR n=1 Tax=unclassified Marinilactibacillus TaxID=2632303 RepID=UPI001CE42B7A|nr:MULTISPECIES: peroxide-responsive transcriptional repressor PerR [unclassified Marinilactibacillus]MEC6747371.1 peroxide-responsive transcriptional repressor PerR [Marinilactibacillus sp. XAAS-LB27]